MTATGPRIALPVVAGAQPGDTQTMMDADIDPPAGTREPAEQGAALGAGAVPDPVRILESRTLDSVWVANRVGFALRTVGTRQYAAYYDATRRMTVAARSLGDETWEKTALPSQLVWDSHNGVALGIDEQGCIHVSGNMHARPLVYFRSRRPHDIREMQPLHRMVGRDEASVTYPRFFNDNRGRLLFSYRSGTCGNGNILLNRFEPRHGRWVRHLTTPLFEGTHEGDKRAAYHTFTRDAAGNFHFLWMWRRTPMVETCHQLCYAKSPDLVHWTNAAGEEAVLPFRPDTQAVTVDDTPVKGGMHNSRYRIILTPDGTPILGYVKYDSRGLTQLHVARFNSRGWLIRQISNWDFRWVFVGGGDRMSPRGVFRFDGFAPADGLLVISWSTENGRMGTYRLDPETLEHVDSRSTVPPHHPGSLGERLSDAPGMSVCLQEDSAGPRPDGSRYVLKWEARGKSHGKHAPDVIPDGPLSPLTIVAFRPGNPPRADGTQ